MKKYLATILFLLAGLPAFAQQWGIGLRAGDPAGLTVKKYMNGKALELNIGRSHTFSSRGWYGDRFNQWYYDQHFPYETYEYIGYKQSLPLAIQVHYLIQKDLSKVAGENTQGLDWYLGLGGQIRSQTYKYEYRYKLKGDPNWYYVKDENVRDLDLGVDGVIGLEYTFDDLPISIFADVTLFLEAIDDPFMLWPQGGAGVRFNLE
jgi:hypothetical protein